MLQSVIMLKLIDTEQKGKAMLLSVLIPSLMLALVSSATATISTISKRRGLRLMNMLLSGNQRMGPYLWVMSVTVITQNGLPARLLG